MMASTSAVEVITFPIYMLCVSKKNECFIG
jgi:hypothetical protein